jgi:hypothetical protein
MRRPPDSKPANGMTTDSGSVAKPANEVIAEAQGDQGGSEYNLSNKEDQTLSETGEGT